MKHKEGAPQCAGTDNTLAVKPSLSSSLAQFSSEYPAQYFNHDGQRSHFIDTGAGQYERTVLCLHSRFGWAYSFRKIIPKLVYHGFRVVAVDLLGFGLSDKPEDAAKLTISEQSARVKALIQHLGLSELTLVAHEMGASVAAQLPRMLPDTVETLVFVNPASRIVENGWPGLHMWRTLMNAGLEIDVTAEIARICPGLTMDELEAYNEPFKTSKGLIGPRHFHETVVLEEGDPDYAFVENSYRWLREKWTGRNFVLAGTEDPIFGVDAAKNFCNQIGCTKGVIQLDDVSGHPFEQQPSCIDLVTNELFAAR
ncbi:MAG: alpha/beta fold hydrolase [Hyphomonadaceae bacterium]